MSICVQIYLCESRQTTAFLCRDTTRYRPPRRRSGGSQDISSLILLRETSASLLIHSRTSDCPPSLGADPAAFDPSSEDWVLRGRKGLGKGKNKKVKIVGMPVGRRRLKLELLCRIIAVIIIAVMMGIAISIIIIIIMKIIVLLSLLHYFFIIIILFDIINTTTIIIAIIIIVTTAITYKPTKTQTHTHTFTHKQQC